MIDKIEITNNEMNLIIFPKENKVQIRNRKVDISDEEINMLLSIIRTWKHNYGSSKYFDGIKLNINVYYKGQVDSIKSTGEMPNGYLEFDRIVRELYDRK